MAPLLPALHVLTKPVPFTTGGLALPAPAVELVALLYAEAALRAAVGVPCNIRRNSANALARSHADICAHPVPEEPREGFQGAGKTDGRANKPAINNFTRIEDVFRIDFPLELPEALHPLKPKHLRSLFREVQACRVDPPSVPLGDVGYGEGEAENKVIAESSPIAGNKTENDDFRLFVWAFADDDPLFHNRLSDFFFDFIHKTCQTREGEHHLCGYQAGPQPLDQHHLEAVLPFMMGDRLIQYFRLTCLYDLGKPLRYRLAILFSKGQSDNVRFGQQHTLFSRMSPMLPQGGPVPHLCHAGVDEEKRPNGELLLDYHLSQPLHV